jgi:hypothetical protein
MPMPLPTSLGLLPEIWSVIFAKSRRLARWDARVAQMDALLRRSRVRWIESHEVYGQHGPNPLRILGQRCIVYANRFKMMEVTKISGEEITDVSVYVYDVCCKNYMYMDEMGLNALFEDYSSDDEGEFLEEIEDAP